MKRVIIIFAVFSLCGCALFQRPPHSIDDLEVNPDPEKLSQTHAYLDTSDQTVKELKLPTIYSDYIEAKLAARANPAKVPDYISAGIALSNRACTEWIELHNKHHEEINEEQSVVNLVGTVMIALMGLEEAHVNTMGAVAILFGGVNSGYEVVKSSRFLSDTIYLLKEGVEKGRRESAANLKANASGSKPYTYTEAYDALSDYHNTCSRTSLISFIEASVKLTRIEIVDESDVVKNNELISLGRSIYEHVNNERSGAYSEKRLKDLYIMFFAQDSEAAKKLKKLDHYAAIDATITKLKGANEGSEERQRSVDFYDDLGKVGDLLDLDEQMFAQEIQAARLNDEINGLKAKRDKLALTQFEKSIGSLAEKKAKAKAIADGLAELDRQIAQLGADRVTALDFTKIPSGSRLPTKIQVVGD